MIRELSPQMLEYWSGVLDLKLKYNIEPHTRKVSSEKRIYFYPRLTIYTDQKKEVDLLDTYIGKRSVKRDRRDEYDGIDIKTRRGMTYEWRVSNTEQIREVLGIFYNHLTYSKELAESVLDLAEYKIDLKEQEKGLGPGRVISYQERYEEEKQFAQNLEEAKKIVCEKRVLPSPVSLAGMIDFSGNIGIRRVRVIDQLREFDYSGYVALYTNYLGLLDILNDEYQGYIITNSDSKWTNYWEVGNTQALKVLDKIIPHSIIYKDIARVLRNFLLLSEELNLSRLRKSEDLERARVEAAKCGFYTQVKELKKAQGI